jgi:hypothetical protein
MFVISRRAQTSSSIFQYNRFHSPAKNNENESKQGCGPVGCSNLHTNFRISVEVGGPTYDVECVIHIGGCWVLVPDVLSS